MRNKRAIAAFIVDERKRIGRDRDQRDGALVLSKEQLIGILVKFEEDIERLPFENRKNSVLGGISE